MRTWLLVGAERREFAGVLKRVGKASKLEWPGVKFARQAMWKGDRWWMIANGPGKSLACQAVSPAAIKDMNVSGVISTGLCGGLDPALRVGDIVVDGEPPGSARAYRRGQIISCDRVIVSSREKRILRNDTGAVAVDMETGGLRENAAELNLPFRAIRAVSDTAGSSLPLDFNRFQNARGDFSRGGIALAALAHPLTVLPHLLEFDRDCRRAADALGDFLVDCQF